MPFLDLYNMTNTILPAGTNILDVTAKVWVGATRADGTSNARIYIRTGGTNYFGSLHTFTDTTWIQLSKTWTSNPGTGVAWTTTELGSVQAGFALTGDTTPAFPRGTNYFPTYGSQVELHVKYPEPTRHQFNPRLNEHVSRGFN